MFDSMPGATAVRVPAAASWGAAPTMKGKPLALWELVVERLHR